MQTQLSALAHTALAFGQSAAFLVPEAGAAVKVATAFVGMDALVQIFFPGDAPPPAATQAEMEQGFASLADLITQTAWLKDLQGHIAAVRQAIVAHDAAFNDFQAGKYGQTPIAQLTKALADDWQRMYQDVKSYGDISSTTTLNPLLAVCDWAVNDAPDYASDPAKKKWIRFEVLPLYCSAQAAFISFCKLALMIELHDALTTDAKGSPAPQSTIMPDDYLQLVPSEYFEHVDQALNGTSGSTGCIKYVADVIKDYDQETQGLQADLTWRKGRVSVQPRPNSRTPGGRTEYVVRDEEADWTSVHYPDQVTAATQLSLYEASILGAYATERAATHGVGGLRKADADALRTLYTKPWDELRRDLIKSRRAWDAKYAPPQGGGS